MTRTISLNGSGLVMAGLRTLAAAMLIAGCVNYAKKGDQAAATGNWRSAVEMYQKALQDEPGSGSLQQKYANARTEAIKVAMSTATRCRGEQDHACVEREANYVISLDPGNQPAADLRTSARTELAAAALTEASGAANRAEFGVAAAALTRADQLSKDPALRERATEIARTMAPAATEYSRTVLGQPPSGDHAARLARYEEVVSILSHVLAFAPESAGLMATAKQRRDDAASALAQQRARDEAVRQQTETRDLANRSRTVAVLGATIGAGKYDETEWDGPGKGAVQAMNSNIAKALGAARPEVAIALAVAGPTMAALSKPDVSGTADLLTSPPRVDARRRLDVEESFTPGWSRAEWAGVDIRSARIRVTLVDEDLTANDSIGTVEISAADMMRAADSGGTYQVVVGNASNKQILIISISVR